MGKTTYSRTPATSKGINVYNLVAKSSARDLRVHFKNTY